MNILRPSRCHTRYPESASDTPISKSVEVIENVRPKMNHGTTQKEVQHENQGV